MKITTVGFLLWMWLPALSKELDLRPADERASGGGGGVKAQVQLCGPRLNVAKLAPGCSVLAQTGLVRLEGKSEGRCSYVSLLLWDCSSSPCDYQHTQLRYNILNYPELSDLSVSKWEERLVHKHKMFDCMWPMWNIYESNKTSIRFCGAIKVLPLVKQVIRHRKSIIVQFLTAKVQPEWSLWLLGEDCLNQLLKPFLLKSSINVWIKAPVVLFSLFCM